MSTKYGDCHHGIPLNMICGACQDEQRPKGGTYQPEPGTIVELNPSGVEDVVAVEPEVSEVPLPEAPELLGRAARHMHDRAVTYDTLAGERSMGKAVRAFNAITGRELTEAEGWLLLQVLKDVRLFTRPNYHADSAEDCIAYAALKAEAKSKEA